MSGRVMLAGIGNVFLGDDGFGVEVAHRLESADLPDGVQVVDYGIRGVHLAYELLDGRHDSLILIDAVPLGDEPPGTLQVLDVDTDRLADEAEPMDAHSMSPDVVLRTLAGLGGDIGRVLVVGCQPASVTEGMELSAPVAAAVDEAARLAVEVARDEAAQYDDTSRTDQLALVGAAAATDDRQQGRHQG